MRSVDEARDGEPVHEEGVWLSGQPCGAVSDCKRDNAVENARSSG